VVDACDAGDEGLTLLGGEPLDQLDAVTALAGTAQAAGLGVICFTGYTMETVRARAGGELLLRHVDLLVDGPYVAAAPSSAP